MAERTETDLLVVGAGPAGLAAAVAASGKGLRVTMVDENPQAGGQIWRPMAGEPAGPAPRMLAQMFQARAQMLAPASVVGFDADDTARIVFRGGHGTVRFQKAVLATGARELFLPFPGWTLPGVFGVGGLQALVKQGLPIRGRRVVVAGSGPLLLAVAKHLRKCGAKVAAILEQAPPKGMRELLFALGRFPSKLGQAATFATTVAKVKPGWWVTEALGTERLASVQISDGVSTREIACDYLACAYGLAPNTELAQVAGCRIEKGFVAVDDLQRTSQPRLFCAGEPVEIGGAEAAIVQGTIAGLAAAGAELEARTHLKEMRKCHDFARALARAFPLREEVRRVARAETLVCRCEDVSFGELEEYGSFREAKIQTRIGMGPCQGRICGAACQAIKGWEAPTVRPPVVPVPMEALVREE